MQQPLAYIPSPSQGVVHLGPLPLRGYALMIILGVVVAVWLGERRWVARGGSSGTVVDIAVWAVPFGLVGGRLYHVITDNQLYFGHGRHPIDAFKVWNGGLGIWGAIACGALGAYLGCRRRGVSLRTFADAAAPGIALAQGIGRWGNWFNQELFGRPSKLPWAVKIDPAHRMPDPKYADIATYQPTFLYESLWCIGVALLVIWAERRFRLAYGRTFALYVAAYTVGRAWIEWLRIDSAHHILGLRLNDWTSLIVFLAAVGYMYLYRDRTEIPPGAVGVPSEAQTPDGGAEPADDTTDTTETGGEPEPAATTGDAAKKTDAAKTTDDDAAKTTDDDATADDAVTTAEAAATTETAETAATADEDEDEDVDTGAGEPAETGTVAAAEPASETDVPAAGEPRLAGGATGEADEEPAGSAVEAESGDSTPGTGTEPAAAEDEPAGGSAPTDPEPPADAATTATDATDEPAAGAPPANGTASAGDDEASRVEGVSKQRAAAGGEPADGRP